MPDGGWKPKSSEGFGEVLCPLIIAADVRVDATSAAGISPQRYARIGGLLYLIIIVAGLSGELFVRGSMVVSGDAVATARNITASPALWRAGVAGDLLMHMCDFALVLYPPLASRLFPAIMLPPFVAELSLALWLLVKGVDVRKWPAQSHIWW